MTSGHRRWAAAAILALGALAANAPGARAGVVFSEDFNSGAAPIGWTITGTGTPVVTPGPIGNVNSQTGPGDQFLGVVHLGGAMNLSIMFGGLVNQLVYDAAFGANSSSVPTVSVFTLDSGGNVKDFVEFIAPSDPATPAAWFSRSVSDADGFYGIRFSSIVSGGFRQGNDGGFDNFVGSTADAVSVPEPATIALLGAGILGLAGLRRQKETDTPTVLG